MNNISVMADDNMDHTFSISTLKIICDIAETLCLSKSAKRLNKRQANISRALMNVEAQTGLQIFDRTVRPAVITPAGQQLITLIERHLATHHALEEFIDGYKKNASGKVRIDAPSGQLLLIARYVLPQLHRLHPDINIELYTSNLTVNDLAWGVSLNDECDILFTHTLPSNENLLAYNVISVQMNVYGTAELIKHHPVNTKDDFHTVPCILFHSFMNKGSNIWQFHQKHNRYDIRVNGNYSCDNAFTALELARAGLGYLYIPELLIREVNHEETFIPVLPDDLTARFTTYMIYKPRVYQPYRVELVLKAITDSLAQLERKIA